MRTSAHHLLELHAETPAVSGGLCERVRDVVILASSSRGGSSVLAEILRHSQDLLHFRAEINPFLDLAGLTWPSSGSGSDRLGPEHAGESALLDSLLAQDAGRPGRRVEDVDRFARQLQWRLSMQWPLERFDLERVQAWTADTLDELGWDAGFDDSQLFTVLLLRRARHEHPAVDPWFYDLPPELVRAHCPDTPVPRGPPSPVILEEPPFVTFGPWQPLKDSDMDRPLIIKTPSNAYRLPFLRALFPSARFRILHLTRNAAASINGLVDGWRYRGFFSHRVPGELAIAGYSDRSVQGADWWKFDLPPGWQEWTRRPLVEVCGFQWRSAHRATLDTIDATGVESYRVRFEDLVAELPARRAAFDRLADWLGIPLDDELGRLVRDGLPPIMATSRPRHRRWYDRADLLEPVVHSPGTLSIMERLGYGIEPDTWT